MTQDEKDLLLKDLCARLPYGVKGETLGSKTCTLIHLGKEGDFTADDYHGWLNSGQFIPYLRPMSSMTEEEKRTLQSFYPMPFGNQYLDLDKERIELYECNSTMEIDLYDSVQIVDFCRKNHLDCYGLIKKGLALEIDEFYNPYED